MHNAKKIKDPVKEHAEYFYETSETVFQLLLHLILGYSGDNRSSEMPERGCNEMGNNLKIFLIVSGFFRLRFAVL